MGLLKNTQKALKKHREQTFKKKPKRDQDDYDNDFFDDNEPYYNQDSNLLKEENDIISDDTYDDYVADNSNNDAEVIRIRIETQHYINKIKLQLENKYIKKIRVRNKETGEIEYKQTLEQLPNTKPLANSQGVAQITGIVSSLIDQVISQGNLPPPLYENIMNSFMIKFTSLVIINRKVWEIDVKDIKSIRLLIITAIEIYLTRPVYDKEREGLNNQPRRPDDEGEKQNWFAKVNKAISGGSRW